VYKIKHIKMTAYNPQANGQVERTNCTIKDILTKITPRSTGNWSHYLQSAVHVTRITKQGSTNFSPSEILYGHQIRQHFDLGEFDQEQKDPEDYILEEVARISQIRHQASKFIKKAQDRQKEYYDAHQTLTEPLKIGDLVLIYQNLIESNWSAKLEPKWEGPYLIQDIKGTSYHLRTSSGSILPTTIHRNHLKLYHERAHLPTHLHPPKTRSPVVELETPRRHR
jgi:hypothetical protein